MKLTPTEAQGHCYNAGFRFNKGIIIMPSIGWAESRLDTEARGYNYDPKTADLLSTDRGWLQINDKAFPNITDAQCDDPAEAARIVWSISRQGTSFSAWAAYNSGAYKGPESVVYQLFAALWDNRACNTAKSALLAELADAHDTIFALEESESQHITQLLALQDKIDKAKADLA